MANDTIQTNDSTRPTPKITPATIISGVALGAVTASTMAVGSPAFAAPDYPSWTDIENAKQDEAAKQAEAGRLSQLLAGLRTAADDAMQVSMSTAETYRIAQDDLAEAVAKEQSLAHQADEAAARAEISKMRAGLIAAHVARQGGGDLSTNLMLNGDQADKMLQDLGRATKLGEQAQAAYNQAVQDDNTASSLRAGAERARAERELLNAAASAKYQAAIDAESAATAAVAEQQNHSDELYAQLATLKDSTAELERQREEGLAIEAAEAAARAAAEQAAREQAEREAAAQAEREAAEEARQAAEQAAAAATQREAEAAQRQANAAQRENQRAAEQQAQRNAPAKSEAPSVPTGSGPGTANPGSVETAINFASAQLGKRYVLGGMGPSTWDCSGLTKAAFAQAGVNIGTHSATNQYNTLAARGKAVALSNIQRGDLVFWSTGNGVYEHVAIYLGGGKILEAANENAGVRIRNGFWATGKLQVRAAARPLG